MLSNFPIHLLPIYQIVQQSFGKQLNQHQYEGLIVLLYNSMSYRNMGQLLATFVNTTYPVVMADVDKYCHRDVANYSDVLEHLNKHGFQAWLSAVDFHVTSVDVKGDALFVYGRLIEGATLAINDSFYTIRNEQSIEAINLRVVAIEQQAEQAITIELGSQAKLQLAGTVLPKISLTNAVLSSQKLVENY